MSSLKTIDNHHSSTSTMSEYRQLEYELQCQEALLVLMQKLKTNQRLISQTKQRTTTTPAAPPVNATKLNTTTPNKPSTVCVFTKGNDQNRFIVLFRFRQIDQEHRQQSQSNHRILINIPSIDLILILNLNHRKFLNHYLKPLVRRITPHYPAQQLVSHRPYLVQQQKPPPPPLLLQLLLSVRKVIFSQLFFRTNISFFQTMESIMINIY